MAHAVSLAVPRGRAWGSAENPWAQCVKFATSMRLPPNRPLRKIRGGPIPLMEPPPHLAL
jgi:hypothetical protein